MRLILNIYNPAGVTGFAYAYVDLDADLTQLILQRREIFDSVRRAAGSIVAGASGDTLACMEYREYSAAFLSGLPDETETPNCDDGGDFDETTLTYADLKDYTKRTDCDRMCITENYVYWTAYPHHSDRSLTIETNRINFATVERAAAEMVGVTAA